MDKETNLSTTIAVDLMGGDDYPDSRFDTLLRILKSQDDIDIILLDIIMPIMGGIDFLKVARTDDNMKEIPVIVLTTDETIRAEALDVGANDFLTKPIREKEITAKINKLIF